MQAAVANDEAYEPRPMRVGLFGIGLSTYWGQFEGLKDRLEGYLADIGRLISRNGIELVNLGLVDNEDAGLRAGEALRSADVDLVFIHAATYALSSTVLPAVRRLNVPIIVLNLQPDAALDFQKINAMGDRTKMTGTWLAYCGSCPVPEIVNVLSRAGIAVHQITGMVHGDDLAQKQIDDWIEAGRVAHELRHTRMGLLGHYYNGMLDIYADLTTHAAAFGIHFEHFEMDELAAARDALTQDEINQVVARFEAEFDIQPDCDPQEIERAARTGAALMKLVGEKRLGALAYFCNSVPGHVHEDLISSIILGCSLLTATHVPVAGEYEVKNAIAMKIMDAFGTGGSFTEFYTVDFAQDVVLMGHDGPGHTQIAQGKTKVRPLQVYHGKVGKGVSVEMSVAHGPVTLLSVVERWGRAILLVAEGESVPGEILEIGNTNSRYRFDIGAREFVEQWNAEGPAHHCAIGLGHIADKLDKFATLLGLEIVRVC